MCDLQVKWVVIVLDVTIQLIAVNNATIIVSFENLKQYRYRIDNGREGNTRTARLSIAWPLRDEDSTFATMSSIPLVCSVDDSVVR